MSISSIYHEDGSGSSLVVNNMKVNSLEGNILKKQFSKTTNNINIDNTINNIIIKQNLNESDYSINATFQLISSMISTPVIVNTATLYVLDDTETKQIGSNSININQTINSGIFSIIFNGLQQCTSRSKTFSFKIEVDSDIGVFFSFVLIQAIPEIFFPCPNQVP
jgi:hypothetical protein